MATSFACRQSPAEAQLMLVAPLVQGWPGRRPELPAGSRTGATWSSASVLAGVMHQLLAVCFSYPCCIGSAGKTLQCAPGLAAFCILLVRGIIWKDKEETICHSLFLLVDRNKFLMRIVGEIPWQIEGFDKRIEWNNRDSPKGYFLAIEPFYLEPPPVHHQAFPRRNPASGQISNVYKLLGDLNWTRSFLLLLEMVSSSSKCLKAVSTTAFTVGTKMSENVWPSKPSLLGPLILVGNLAKSKAYLWKVTTAPVLSGVLTAQFRY